MSQPSAVAFSQDSRNTLNSRLLSSPSANSQPYSTPSTPTGMPLLRTRSSTSLLLIPASKQRLKSMRRSPTASKPALRAASSAVASGVVSIVHICKARRPNFLVIADMPLGIGAARPKICSPHRISAALCRQIKTSIGRPASNARALLPLARSLKLSAQPQNAHPMTWSAAIKRFPMAVIGALSLTLPLPANMPAARAQSADLVLCDRIAADPSDPDKPADVKGVSDIAASDVATAIKFCKRASTTSRRALYELGRAYAADRQMSEAVSAYRKAADKGSSAAMVELGSLLASGSAGPKDETEARTLFARAAQTGNARGAANLAALSADGGGSADPAEARAMLTKAAETNSAEAQFQLGLMMANSVGGPKHDIAARGLLAKDPAQGHA